MRAKTEIEDGEVSYRIDYDTQHAVYFRMLEWFVKRQAFDGEIIMQSDACLQSAPELLIELAEIFDFKVNWNDD